MKSRILKHLPEVELDELYMLDEVTAELEEDDLDDFALLYRNKRRKSDIILLLAAIGFFGAAGIHRLYLNQVAMGIIYFFTGGLCLVGTIIDLINYKKLTFEYNERIAYEMLDRLHFKSCN